MSLDPKLAEYSLHDLIQEIQQRAEFFGVIVYGKRPAAGAEPAHDHALFVGRPESIDRLVLMKILARAIELLATESLVMQR